MLKNLLQYLRQCNYQNKTEKGFLMPERKRKHRLSQVDGMDDFNEQISIVAEIVTLELDELGGIVGSELPPNTTPSSKVLLLKAGIGHKQQELLISNGDTFVTSAMNSLMIQQLILCHMYS